MLIIMEHHVKPFYLYFQFIFHIIYHFNDGAKITSLRETALLMFVVIAEEDTAQHRSIQSVLLNKIDPNLFIVNNFVF